MADTIKIKHTSCGTVEIRQSGTMYALVVNGYITKQSSDFSYILREYENLR